ncbi:MAG: hypothetical protein RLZZ292_310 [Bacteroidota bacterium]|jgi:hypothetical protein
MSRPSRVALQFLENEARTMLHRLEQVKPFAVSMPMVPAAAVSDEAFKEITDHIVKGCRALRQRIYAFLAQLKSPEGQNKNDATLQGEYALLKLRFNAILDQFDIFADVLTQRAEHKTGVWVAGLDVLARDALILKAGTFYTIPPLMCFLERGHGAAIRKARTRLPGGDLNPVAIIQVPRERMVGSGIAASLIHEVGHQAAGLLDLVETLRAALQQQQQATKDVGLQQAWLYLNRCISEIIADFWAMGHLGIGATQGLMSVVSLPRYFMFRYKLDDPHPFPWIRVKLSIGFGKIMYPHQQWAGLEELWNGLYPIEGLSASHKATIQQLERIIPTFVQLVMQHKTKATRNVPLATLLPFRTRQPQQLQALYTAWQRQPEQLYLAAPSLVFAVIGQARADLRIDATTEGRLLSKILQQWAFLRSENRTARKDILAVREFENFIS